MRIIVEIDTFLIFSCRSVKKPVFQYVSITHLFKDDTKFLFSLLSNFLKLFFFSANFPKFQTLLQFSFSSLSFTLSEVISKYTTFFTPNYLNGTLTSGICKIVSLSEVQWCRRYDQIIRVASHRVCRENMSSGDSHANRYVAYSIATSCNTSVEPARGVLACLWFSRSRVRFPANERFLKAKNEKARSFLISLLPPVCVLRPFGPRKKATVNQSVVRKLSARYTLER